MTQIIWGPKLFDNPLLFCDWSLVRQKSPDWLDSSCLAGSLSHTRPQLHLEFFIKISLQMSLQSSMSVSDDTTLQVLPTNYELLLLRFIGLSLWFYLLNEGGKTKRSLIIVNNIY